MHRGLNFNFCLEEYNVQIKPLFLRRKEVATYFNISESTVFRWWKSGHLPSPIELGPNRTVWDKAEIDKWIEKKKEIRDDQLKKTNNIEKCQ